MNTIYRNLKITSFFKGDKNWDATDTGNWNNHVVTVYNMETKKKTSFEFWGSKLKPEISTEEELLFALYCFLSDGNCVCEDFCSWCDNYGYGTDIRKAYKVYKACKKSLEKAHRVVGNDDIICDILNDLQENHGC